MAKITTMTQKRRAPTQAGPPKTKKVILDKQNKPSAAPAKESKKRSVPITKPIAPVDDSDSDGPDGDDDVGLEEEEQQDGEADAAMEVDSKPPKDPNASRESHKVQKDLHNQRRAAKRHSELLVEAKRVWSLARKKDIPVQERRKHIAALMDVIRGNVKDVVLKHDASRIVQTVVKYGTQQERDQVAGELKGKYKELAQSKYSKFLVTKLIRFCPSHRASILAEFQGQIIRLLLHREASGVLADAFELYASAYERSLLLRDFYGKETALFTVTSGSEADKDRAKKGLQGVLEGVEGERRRRIMSAVKENLMTVFNNPDKGAVTHAIVHRALWEYLVAVAETGDEAEQEKLRREMFESCQDVLAELVHTRDGSRVVREFIAQGTAKDRKHIVKAIKPHVERMCTSDEAQLVLFSALDIIDDTKLTGKSLITDVVTHASTLVSSPQGRRALLYPLVPRTRRHFTHAQISSLAETDDVRARTSKKEAAVRADEVRRAASEGLLEWIAKDGAAVSRDPGGSLVVGEVMLYAEGDRSAASTTLLQAVAAPYPSEDESFSHPIALAHTSRLYKTLLQGGHFSHVSKQVEPSPHFSPTQFAEAWVRVVGRDVTLAIARGEGAFVVAELCARLAQAGEGEGDGEASKELSGWLSGEQRKLIVEWDGRGKEVLLEKVDALLAVPV